MIAESIDTATWLFMVDDVGTGTRYVLSHRVCMYMYVANHQWRQQSRSSREMLLSRSSRWRIFFLRNAFLSLLFRWCSLDARPFASLMAEPLSPVSSDPLKSFAIGHSAI
jgi:uncharacterized membrane protein YedE/YeeE